MNLGEILDLYGFGDSYQKGLINLIEISGGFDNAQVRENLSELGGEANADSFLEAITSINDKETLDVDPKVPTATIDWLIKVTQKNFYLRSNGDVRWKLQLPNWMIDNSAEILNIAEDMGITKEVMPKEKQYDAMAIFGARKSEIDKRISFALKLIQNDIISQPEFIYLLSGERYVEDGKDGKPVYLNSLADSLNKARTELTEFDVMLDIFERKAGNNITSEIISINSEGIGYSDIKGQVKFRGPNTMETIVDFTKQLKTGIESVLFISRAPYTMRQASNVAEVMEEQNIDIKYEIAGAGCHVIDLPQNMRHRAAYHVVAPIAEQLYVDYPKIVQGIDSNLLSEYIKQRRVNLGLRQD